MLQLKSLNHRRLAITFFLLFGLLAAVSRLLNSQPLHQSIWMMGDPSVEPWDLFFYGIGYYFAPWLELWLFVAIVATLAQLMTIKQAWLRRIVWVLIVWLGADLTYKTWAEYFVRAEFAENNTTMFEGLPIPFHNNARLRAMGVDEHQAALMRCGLPPLGPFGPVMRFAMRHSAIFFARWHPGCKLDGTQTVAHEAHPPAPVVEVQPVDQSRRFERPNYGAELRAWESMSQSCNEGFAPQVLKINQECFVKIDQPPLDATVLQNPPIEPTGPLSQYRLLLGDPRAQGQPMLVSQSRHSYFWVPQFLISTLAGRVSPDDAYVCWSGSGSVLEYEGLPTDGVVAIDVPGLVTRMWMSQDERSLFLAHPFDRQTIYRCDSNRPMSK
jgi:hypothetical protein